MANTQPCALLGLPAEIRNRIYVYTFCGVEVNTSSDFPYYAPGLLLANKQIHKETLEVFYSHATFYLGFHLQFRWLLHAIKPYESLIPCVRVMGGAASVAVDVPTHEVLRWANDDLNKCKLEMESAGVLLNNGVLQVAMIYSADPNSIIWWNESGEVSRESTQDYKKRFKIFAHYYDEQDFYRP